MHAELSIDINAPVSRAIDVYLDYRNWHKLFPLTIRAVKFISKENNVLTVEVNHETEGFVMNILTVLSDHEIKLEEFKPRFNATFINRFQKIPTGTKFTVMANVSPKNFYKLIEPFIKPIVKNRIRKFVLQPMKKFLESNQNVIIS